MRTVVAAVVAFACVACGSDGGGGRTISGTVTLVACNSATTCEAASSVQANNPEFAPGKRCDTSDSGLADIRSGAQVTVTDGRSEVIATGRLQPGSYGTQLSCVFPFTIEGVPDADSYGFEVADRGVQRMTADELDAAGNLVELTINVTPRV